MARVPDHRHETPEMQVTEIVNRNGGLDVHRWFHFFVTNQFLAKDGQGWVRGAVQ